MKYTIIVLSALDVWSMDHNKGAPSFYNTLKLYAEKGNEVFLIKPTGKRHLESLVNGVKIIGFNNDFMEYFTNTPKVSFFARMINAKWMTKRFCFIASEIIKKAENPCLVYAYEVHAVEAAAKLSRKFDVPFITRFQGTVLKDYKNTLYNRLRWYPHFQALEQKSSLVVMTDDGTFGTRVLHDLGNTTEKIMFWRNGVSFGSDATTPEKELNAKHMLKEKLGIADDDFVLLSLSRLAQWKRIDRAINAMPQVLRRYHNCKLVIVGEGSMRESLERMVHEKGITENVIFAGGIEQSEAYKYYAMADIFLSLYDIGNVGNPILEALLCGKPVIALNNGDTSSLITDEYNGLLLPVDKPELIDHSIIRLLSDEALRKKLSENALEYSKSHLWTWNDRMEKEYEVVTRLLEEFYPKQDENEQ